LTIKFIQDNNRIGEKDLFKLLIGIFPGNHNGEATPVPIPNTEVKLFSADGTALGAEWESRSLPGFFLIEDFS
jgi:hypothetical protein